MDIKTDKNLVAYCGLYCGACGQYLKGKCFGCQKNEKATWCQIRVCGMQNKYDTCADCKSYTDVNTCKKFNNIFSKIFGLIFRSNRKACIERIKQIGTEKFASEMAKNKMQSIKR